MKSIFSLSLIRRMHSLRNSLRFGFGAVIVLSLVFSIGLYINGERSVATVDTLLKRDRKIAALSLRSTQAMLEARNNESNFLLFRDELGLATARNLYIAKLQEKLKELHGYIKNIEELYPDPVVIKTVQDIEAKSEAYESKFIFFLDLYVMLGSQNSGLEYEIRAKAHDFEQLLNRNGHHVVQSTALLDWPLKKSDIHTPEWTNEQLKRELSRFQSILNQTALNKQDKIKGNALLREYHELLERYISITSATLTAQQEYIPSARAIAILLEELHAAADKRSIATRNQMEQAAAWTKRTTIAALIALTITLAFVAWVVSRQINSSLMRLINFAQTIADGDYTTRIAVPKIEEFARLGRALNGMAAALQLSHEHLSERAQQLAQTNQALEKEIAKRHELQTQMIAIARQAGMAEIATNVLHNVGNVLNSVNVSANLIRSKFQASKTQGLVKAMQLMEDNKTRLGDFFTNDQKGKVLPEYMLHLTDAIIEEQQTSLNEIDELINCIDHIKQIVSAQQSHAKAANIFESLHIEDLVDDACRVSGVNAPQHKIVIEREYGFIPALMLDKSRLLQILINLLTNAKHALEKVTERRLCLKTELVENEDFQDENSKYLKISVKDFGEGIAAENLNRIFSHGFTTRKEGHGFGLHSCANAATEMGGKIEAFSGGVKKGATFVLTLPVNVSAAQKQQPTVQAVT